MSACSDDLRQRAIALGADASTSETIPYGVDTARFRPSAAVRASIRRELGLGDAPVVVSAGRLVKEEGIRVPDRRGRRRSRGGSPACVFSSPVMATFGPISTARAAAHPAVVLLGNRSQDQIADLVAAADVIAVPSIHDDAGNVDGLPNFALEALASGTPVVASDVGGLRHAIRDRETGRLVAERDSSALAGAIGELLADPVLSSRLGRAARAAVERDFGWARVAERFDDIYAHLVAAGRHSTVTPLPLVGTCGEC